MKITAIKKSTLSLAACLMLVVWAMPVTAQASDGYCLYGADLEVSLTAGVSDKAGNNKGVGGGHEKKIDVCHIPPGNPDNAHTINISDSAWPAHQMHGDYLGECGEDSASEVQYCTAPDGSQGIWISTGDAAHDRSYREIRGE